MPATLTITGTKNAMKQQTISGAGFSNNTAYDVFVTDPSGAVTRYAVTSSGTGAFSVTHYPSTPGTMSVEVRPTAERKGTTASLANASVTVGGAAV